MTWFSSLYLMMVLPGVRSMGSPAAALDTWNSIWDITPDVPVVLAVRMIEPFCSRVPRVSASPAEMVSLALSLENRPVDRAANANTDETTTKAISTMAVSSPVIPLWSGSQAFNLAQKLTIPTFIVLSLSIRIICVPLFAVCPLVTGKRTGMDGCRNRPPPC